MGGGPDPLAPILDQTAVFQDTAWDWHTAANC
jgi:hypothetical protein